MRQVASPSEHPAERNVEGVAEGVCQVILTAMKVIDVESLPADPLEPPRELLRAALSGHLWAAAGPQDDRNRQVATQANQWKTAGQGTISG